MTDYSNTIRKWIHTITGNYAKPKLMTPVKNLPFQNPQLDWYLKFNGTHVFDYREAAKFLAENVAEDFPLSGASHGWQDGSIPAKNQA